MHAKIVTPSTDPRNRLSVALIVPSGCSLSSVSTVREVLEVANLVTREQRGEEAFHVQTVTLNGEAVHLSGGVILQPEASASDLPPPDWVILPGFLFSILPALPGLAPWMPRLRHWHAHGALLASICTGAFVLAESGLLDGRPATTHWAFAEAFQARYPSVHLQAEAMITESDRLVCSGGATAGLDMLLYLLRTRIGPEVAAHCARNLLIDQRTPVQTPYRAPTRHVSQSDPWVAEVQRWMLANLGGNWTLEDVARHFHVSLRTLMRRFRSAASMPPNRWLQQARMERARYYLEHSTRSVEAIALAVGYADTNAFRRQFRQHTGLSPGAYRKRMNATASGGLRADSG